MLGCLFAGCLQIMSSGLWIILCAVGIALEVRIAVNVLWSIHMVKLRFFNVQAVERGYVCTGNVLYFTQNGSLGLQSMVSRNGYRRRQASWCDSGRTNASMRLWAMLLKPARYDCFLYDCVSAWHKFMSVCDRNLDSLVDRYHVSLGLNDPAAW